MGAIVLEGVVKRFRKSTVRREYTTFKSELVRWLRGRRDAGGAGQIEALRGVDLVIPRGKTVALIGRNGSGKSTLLKLITGIYKPTEGHVRVDGRISSLLELGAGFHPDFSGRENILINGIILGMTKAEVRARMDDIVAFSELGDFVDEPVRTYSSGMYMRLAFAVATHVDPDILLVDEVLAVGDEHFSKKSLAKMMEFKRAGKTIVLVTHDLASVERWCDEAVWIDAGRVRRVGPPSEVTAEYRRAVELAEQRHEPMLPAALQAGGALPATEPDADAPLRLAYMALEGPEGAVREEFEADEPVTLCATFTAHAALADVALSATLTHEDARVLVFRARSEAALVLHAGETREVRLDLATGGLGPGRYRVELSAEVSGQSLAPTHGMRTLRLRGNQAPGDGLVRLAHRWQLQAAPRAAPAGTSVAEG